MDDLDQLIRVCEIIARRPHCPRCPAPGGLRTDLDVAGRRFRFGPGFLEPARGEGGGQAGAHGSRFHADFRAAGAPPCPAIMPRWPCRTGFGAANFVVPVMSHFAFIVALVERSDENAGIGQRDRNNAALHHRIPGRMDRIAGNMDGDGPACSSRSAHIPVLLTTGGRLAAVI